MSASDFSARLFAPVIALPRRPLSSSESTASCSMRFSFRTMISGAFSSSNRFKRLFLFITLLYKSFRSDVAKRPPSSGTSGRSSGGSTGSTSMIIQSGLMPDFWKASSTFRRLAIFLIFVSDVVAELFHFREVVVLGHQLPALERRHARVDHDVGFEVQHALDVAERHVEH